MHTSAIPTVEALKKWVEPVNKLSASHISIRNRTVNSRTKILAQYADYDKSGNGSVQGTVSSYYYNFKNWKYIDVFAFVGQGLFTIPTPGYINAAHMNGVKIIGAIMAPVNQQEYIKEFEQLFCTECVEQLVKVMDFYGFDGWFINIEEFLPTNVKWTDVQQFMIELVKLSKNVNPDAEIHWYDSNYIFNKPSYEECLNKHNVVMFQKDSDIVSDGFMLDYSWTKSGVKTSIKEAHNVNRSQYDVYAGVYLDSSINKIDQIMTAVDKGLSVALWGLEGFRRTANTREEFDTNRDNFWNDIDYFIHSKPISVKPFSTSFSTGEGDAFWVKGCKMKNEPWGNMSQQDILPVLVKNKLSLIKNIVYDGGTSLCYTKTCTEDEIITLFKSDMIIDKDTRISCTTYKSDIDLYLQFDTDGSTNTTLVKDSKYYSNGWTTTVYRLTNIKKCKITSMNGVFCNGKIDDKLCIGHLSVHNCPTVKKVTDVKITDVVWHTNEFGLTSANFTISWTDNKSRYYDIYKQTPDCRMNRWVGRAYSTAYRVEDVYLKGDIDSEDNSIVYYIYPVNFSGSIGDSSTVEFRWNKK